MLKARVDVSAALKRRRLDRVPALGPEWEKARPNEYPQRELCRQAGARVQAQVDVDLVPKQSFEATRDEFRVHLFRHACFLVKDIDVNGDRKRAAVVAAVTDDQERLINVDEQLERVQPELSGADQGLNRAIKGKGVRVRVVRLAVPTTDRQIDR